MSYIYLPECPSTNLFAMEQLEREDLAEGTYIYTDRQTAGRGQLGNRWESAPYQNITASIVLYPTFLPVQRQFWLNIIAALAVYDFACEYIGNQGLFIKWANDLLYKSKKLSGILVQTLWQQGIRAAVVGIGFNVNQLHFEHAPNAVSLHQITGRYYPLWQMHMNLKSHLMHYYHQLRQGSQDELQARYLSRLWQLHQKARYRDREGIFEGVVQGIDSYGRLVVEKLNNHQHYTYDVKQIEFLA